MPSSYLGSTPSTKSGGHHSLFGKILGGIAGFGTHLADDTKAAVVGVPTGLVMTAEHPIRAAKVMARQTWHDWKPLVEGHPGTFLKQTYDHPLAPLLDVATVFSAGAAGAARLGAGLEAVDTAGAEGSFASKLADLGRPSSRMVPDAAGRAKDVEAAAAKAEGGSKAFPGGRPVGNHKSIMSGQDYGVRAPIKDTVSGVRHEQAPLEKTYSASPAANIRRLVANRALMHLEPHLPDWFSQGARDSRVYGRLQKVDDAHKIAAANETIKTMMIAGKTIDDPEALKTVTPAIMAHNYANFVNHGLNKNVSDGLASGERYVLAGRHAEPKFAFDPKNSDLAKRMDKFANDFTTDDPAKAEIRGGKAKVIRTDEAKAVAQEGGNSTRFLRKLAKNPTLMWKRVQVGYAPRVITNNTVGNIFMHAMRSGPVGGARGLIDAVKYSHGQRAAMSAFKDMHDSILRGEVNPTEVTKVPVAPRIHEVGTDPVNGHTMTRVDSDELFHAMPMGDHLYHSTPVENFKGVQESGLTPGKVRPGEVHGVYLAQDGLQVMGLQPATRRAGDVFLRAKKAHLNTEITDMYKPGSGFEEHVSREAIPPHKLEYRGADGQWHPVAKPAEVTRPLESNAERANKFTALAHPALYGHASFENGKLIPAVDSDARIRSAFGDRAADAVKVKPNWISKHYKQEVNDGLGNVLEADQTKGGAVRQHLRGGLYPIVHRISDQPIRVAALYDFMRKSPEVRAFLKTHPGTDLDTAIDKSLDNGASGASLRERGAQHVRSIAGDYTTVSPIEKMIQNIMPFYLWDKHVTKNFGKVLSENPGRIALMQKTSQMGNDETQKLLGNLPDFMKGALPLSLLGLHERDGRTPILAPSGLNPYGTIGDLAQLAGAATVDPSSQHAADAAGDLSPALSGLIEQITGKKIGTEAPVAHTGQIIPRTLEGMFGSTSYGTLAKQLIEGAQNTGKTTPPSANHPYGTSSPLLYEKNPSTTALGLLGLPIKEASLIRAQQMAAQESGVKKPKKRSASNPYGR